MSSQGSVNTALSVTATDCLSSLSQPSIGQDVDSNQESVQARSHLFPSFESTTEGGSTQTAGKKQPDVERMYREYIQTFNRKSRGNNAQNKGKIMPG